MEFALAGAALFAMLSPFINAAIQRVTWTPTQKSLLAWGVSAVIALAYLFLTGDITSLSSVIVAIPAAYGAQQAVYQFLVKNIATKFEVITTPGATAIAPVGDDKVAIASDVKVEVEGGTPTVIIKDPDVAG